MVQEFWGHLVPPLVYSLIITIAADYVQDRSEHFLLIYQLSYYQRWPQPSITKWYVLFVNSFEQFLLTSSMFQFIQSEILLRKEMCPVCLQVKASAFQLAFGVGYPTLLAPLASYVVSVWHFRPNEQLHRSHLFSLQFVTSPTVCHPCRSPKKCLKSTKNLPAHCRCSYRLLSVYMHYSH